MSSETPPTEPGREQCRVEVDRVTEAEWNEIVSLFDDASLYQSWAYGAVSWGERQLSHLVLHRGDEIIAAAQLRLVQVPLLRKGMAYLRWGPLWRRRGQVPDLAVFRKVVRAVADEYAGRRGLMLRVVPCLFREDPLAGAALEVWEAAGFRITDSVRPYRTIRVDLTAAPELIRKQLDQKWRNQLNGAERNGLKITEGTSDQYFERFLTIYDEMMQRKRFDTTADPHDFARMQNRLPNPLKMLVMLAEKDDQLMAGLVATAVGEMGIYLHGATSTAGMKSKGSYLLQWRMMQRLRESGCRTYDLGGVNPDRNPGVYHFKRGMGGENVCGVGSLCLSAGLLSTLSVRTGEWLRDASRLFRRLRSRRVETAARGTTARSVS